MPYQNCQTHQCLVTNSGENVLHCCTGKQWSQDCLLPNREAPVRASKAFRFTEQQASIVSPNGHTRTGLCQMDKPVCLDYTCLRQLKPYLFKTGLCYLCHSAFAHILTIYNFKRIRLFKMTLFRCATRRFLYCFALYINCTIISTFMFVSFLDEIGKY